jgi:hypothetical protein
MVSTPFLSSSSGGVNTFRFAFHEIRSSIGVGCVFSSLGMIRKAISNGKRLSLPVAGAIFVGVGSLIHLSSKGQWEPAQTFLAVVTLGSAIAMARIPRQFTKPVLMAAMTVSSVLHLASLISQGGVISAGFFVANACLVLALAMQTRFAKSEVPDTAVRVPETSGRPLTSLVLLLSRPRTMTEPILRQVAGDAWGGNYSEEVQRLSPVTIEVRGIHGRFHVHQLHSTYWPDPSSVAPAIPETNRRSAVLTHRAWLGVDLVEPGDEIESGASLYAPVIRLIVELADPEDTLAIFRPETGQINVWNDEVFGLLVGPGGLERFSRDSAGPPPTITS